MDATTLFIVGLFLLVGCGVFAGELAGRLGQPALVGQLAVGIVFGPTLLGPVIGLTSVSTEFNGLEILATFFVLMTAGLAITPKQIVATGVTSGILGIAIFLVPFLTGTIVVHLLYPTMAWTTSLFVALTVSVTAVPVLGVMLAEFDLLRSRFGGFLMNGALVNELAAVTTFAILLRIQSDGGIALSVDVAIAVLTVAVFLSGILAVHMGLRSLRQLKVWDRWVSQVRLGWHSRELGFATLMVGGLAAALCSQAIGLTFLVGAFYAGLLVTPESIGVREHRQISQVFDAVTWGFFIPLFFALVGFGMNLRSLAASPVTIVAFAGLCVFAFSSKVLVGSAVSRAVGWQSSEALGAGFLTASRGAVELAMAIILLSDGIFSEPTFTIVAGVGLVTTFLSPICARPYVRRLGAPRVAGSAPLPWGVPPFSTPPLSGPKDPPGP